MAMKHRQQAQVLRVVETLGQQDVQEFFQQPAEVITEDVSVMRGPQAQDWIQAVLEKLLHSRSLASMKKSLKIVLLQFLYLPGSF